MFIIYQYILDALLTNKLKLDIVLWVYLNERQISEIIVLKEMKCKMEKILTYKVV